MGGCTATPFIEALTASAPQEIKATIISSLHLNELVVVTQKLDRPNIYLFMCRSVGLKIISYAARQLYCLITLFASLFMQRDLGQLFNCYCE